MSDISLQHKFSHGMIIIKENVTTVVSAKFKWKRIMPPLLMWFLLQISSFWQITTRMERREEEYIKWLCLPVETNNAAKCVSLCIVIKNIYITDWDKVEFCTIFSSEHQTSLQQLCKKAKATTAIFVKVKGNMVQSILPRSVM